MNITVVYATGRKGPSCSYHITQMIVKELLDGGELFEFFLPKDMPHVCLGCYCCIHGEEEKCGGAAALSPILTAIEKSELLIFSTPTYVYHIPGQLKSFLDHLAYRWMVHRPDLSYLKKQALIVNTAAGGGMRSTVRDIQDSLENLGVGRTYHLTQSVWNYDWPSLPASFHSTIEKKVKRTTRTIRSRAGHVTPSLKVRGLYRMYRLLHLKKKMTPVDDAYWENMKCV